MTDNIVEFTLVRARYVAPEGRGGVTSYLSCALPGEHDAGQAVREVLAEICAEKGWPIEDVSRINVTYFMLDGTTLRALRRP